MLADQSVISETESTNLADDLKLAIYPHILAYRMGTTR
jgi:hypothetical protein